MPIIITARPESAAFAVSELQQYDPAIRPIGDLQPGVKRMHIPGGYEKLITDAPPLIFVRHMFPVQWQGPAAALHPANEKLWDPLPLPPSKTAAFSVQGRGSICAEVIRGLETALKEKGFNQNDKHPEWVLSLFFHENEGYAGVSPARHNRSPWNGGAARYAKTENFISRAEFKLMEAIEVFQIKIAPGTRALDLGAAPGGWSKALLDAGCRVTAVDPGALDPRLGAHPHMSYVCATAQRFFEGNPREQFNIIVNDMKMDMHQSVALMGEAARFLAAGGFAVATLKLGKGQGLSKINKALAVLQKKYRAVYARQLFYNRDEITVYLSPEAAL